MPNTILIEIQYITKVTIDNNSNRICTIVIPLIFVNFTIILPTSLLRIVITAGYIIETSLRIVIVASMAERVQVADVGGACDCDVVCVGDSKQFSPCVLERQLFSRNHPVKTEYRPRPLHFLLCRFVGVANPQILLIGGLTFNR